MTNPYTELAKLRKSRTIAENEAISNKNRAKRDKAKLRATQLTHEINTLMHEISLER